MPRPSKAGARISTIQLLNLAASKADKTFAEQLGSIGITPRQYEVLSAVARADGLSQTDIIHDTGIDRSSTAELVARLVRRGWLQRRRTTRDRRIYRVRLTERGRKALTTAEPAFRSTEELLLARLSRLQKAQLLETLNLIVNMDGLAA
jgi:DNA-binding MarR family transcriptional regulator